VTRRIWATIPQFNRSFDLTRQLAARADDLGLRGIMCFDHLIPIGHATRPTLEGAAALGAIAAAASVPVGSMVTRVTLRPPEVTAAIAATLADVGMPGSVLGLGVGDRLSEDEARRFGLSSLDLPARLEVLTRTIDLVRGQSPDLEVWIGGRHRRLRELTARVADGWNAWGATIDELAAEGSEIWGNAERAVAISWGGVVLIAADEKSLAAAIQKRGGAEGVIAGTPAVVVTHLLEIAAIADQLVLTMLPHHPDTWELFASEVIPHLEGSGGARGQEEPRGQGSADPGTGAY
jgi:alkanesulfonate monooxygenase SsuD/methylene tetrahydromethanopterin reductase-like flavin-dependent oxidoreductase (luciferase family)